MNEEVRILGEIFLKELSLSNGNIYDDVKIYVPSYKVLDKKIEKQKIIETNWNGIKLKINCAQIVSYKV